MIDAKKYKALKDMADPLGISVLTEVLGNGVMLREGTNILYEGDEPGACAVLVARTLAEPGPELLEI